MKITQRLFIALCTMVLLAIVAGPVLAANIMLDYQYYYIGPTTTQPKWGYENWTTEPVDTSYSESNETYWSVSASGSVSLGQIEAAVGYQNGYKKVTTASSNVTLGACQYRKLWVETERHDKGGRVLEQRPDGRYDEVGSFDQVLYYDTWQLYGGSLYGGECS